MASFIKIRPVMATDFLMGPRRSGGDLHIVPRESLAPLSSQQQELVEDEKNLRISLDVPGVKASDISVTTDSKVISVSGTRRIFGSGGETAKKTRFSKSFSVDEQTVDLSQLKANLADGVLVIMAPKKPKPAPRSITITTEPHGLESCPTVKEKEIKNAAVETNQKTKDYPENESGKKSEAK